MKITKKILAVVLTVLMVFSLVPLSAFATEWNIQDFEITQLQQGDSITSDVEYIDGFYGYEVRLLANGYQEQGSVRNYDTVGSEMGFRFGEIDQRFLPYGSDKWYVIAVDHDAQTIILSGDADATAATTYTATWKNYDGTVLRTDTNLEEGTTPTYFGKMPAKPSTATHFYAFSGWTPAVAPIVADAIYTATFTEMAKSSTVDGCETFVTKSLTSERTFSGDHFNVTNSVIALDTGCMANANSKTTVSSLNGEKITKLVLTRASGNNIAPVVYVNGTAVRGTQSGDVFTFDNLNATSVQIGTDSSSMTKTAELVAYYKEAGTGVAEVNGTGYATLAEAIAAAGTGDTVTLLDDVTVDSPVVIAAGKDIKLDTNGHSLSGNIADADGKKLIQVSGKLEFVGENGGCIYNTNVAGQGHAACQALTGGTVIVNAPIHFGDSDTDMTNANAVNRGCGIQNNGGTLIINDGYYTSIDANYSTGAWAYAILNCAGDTTVNNATVYGNALHGALGCEEGTFTVNGGTFAVNGANNYYSLYCDGGDFTVNGGTFTNNGKYGVNYVGTGSSTTITGGDFTYSAKTPFVQSSSASNPVVSGGTFSAVVPEKCCAPGFEPVTEPNAQGKYTVEPAGPNNGVNLTLGEDITSNYYVDYQAYEGAYEIEYTYNSISENERQELETKSVYLDNIPASMLEGGRVKITVSQAPAQMGELTEIKILNEASDVLDTLHYSSKTYCDNIIAMDDDALAEYAGTAEKAAALKTLCNTIIAYGYAAQGVFADYETTAITTADFSTAVKNQIDAAYCYAEHSVNNSGAVKFKSVSFACTKDARLRFYLDTAAATGKPAAPKEVNGHAATLKYVVNEGVKVYYIEVSGIDAVDFDQKMEVSYGGSSISCSVLDFCGIAFTYGDTPVQNLARTLIVYNQNAEAYFG